MNANGRHYDRLVRSIRRVRGHFLLLRINAALFFFVSPAEAPLRKILRQVLSAEDVSSTVPFTCVRACVHNIASIFCEF